jgi:pilus assembly protein CpaE
VAREELVSILSAAEDMEVVGAIRNGDAAIALTRKLEPDIVLVDLDLVGKDGIETTEAISTMLPGVGVILLSTDMSAEVLRRAMVAGARQFLQMPPNTEEVLRAVYQVYDTTAARRSLTGRGAVATTAPREGQIIAVFSPKGGVGCTTLATNLAVAIKQEAGMRVALVDGSLTFGDVGVFLDLPPTRSIMDLQVPSEQMDADFVETALVTHERSGIKVLLAPQRPELADMVTGELLRRTITLLRERHEYVIVDTWSALDERVLTALETADKIALVISPSRAPRSSSRSRICSSSRPRRSCWWSRARQPRPGSQCPTSRRRWGGRSTCVSLWTSAPRAQSTRATRSPSPRATRPPLRRLPTWRSASWPRIIPS